MTKTKTAFKPGDVALSRDGHPLRILRIWSEDGVALAEVKYLDGHAPYPNPNGRLGGTYDDPTWEHKVYDTRVVRTGGDYWNDADWVIEAGLLDGHVVSVERPGAAGNRGYRPVCSCGWRGLRFSVNGGRTLADREAERHLISPPDAFPDPDAGMRACEGGPAGQRGCSGGLCRLWPGTDIFEASVCRGEMELDWTKGEAK